MGRAHSGIPWEWEWVKTLGMGRERMGIESMGMGGNGNVKSHSRTSVVRGTRGWYAPALRSLAKIQGLVRHGCEKLPRTWRQASS